MSGNGNNWGNSNDAIINEIRKRVLQRDFEEFGIKRRNIPALGIDYLDILDDVPSLIGKKLSE
ncbi:hypothetical protein [Shewanella sp. 10N.286.52.B9]|uniref:hypothetical protein n=1 Tax=Shewanella sp. 10N.286.52.B9 TaxID=1880837 RepID=UPI000C81D770|nr:hypothetical protein [Shewanella sp. 10N.286.52.B9]PMG41983.1 hypothetical protein BCU91_09295 [Shewanella sp. 10N.286.52.B9]